MMWWKIDMKINFELENQQGFYVKESKRALDWLLEIRDKEQKGWAWVQFIQPNEQNTAEVIATFVDYIDHFNEKEIDDIVESIEKWLLDTSHATISIDYCWVLLALQKVRECPALLNRIDGYQLKAAINDCLQWLSKNRNIEETKSINQLYGSDGIKGCGWGDNDAEISNSIRTALAIYAINREIAFSENSANKQLTVLDSEGLNLFREISQDATKWLLSIQNSDGGWGNIDKKSINYTYEKTHGFSYSDLAYQSDSNAACTGYVMIALSSNLESSYSSQLKKASDFLHKSQKENGGWPIFSEIGIRDGKRYTFRHFSTSWALQAYIISDTAPFNDESVIKGFAYLSSLQDENYGGWKSSSNADNYTWATCNALDTIKLLKKDLSTVEAKEFLKIVCEWWELKKKDTNYSFSIKKQIFAFNAATCLAFCIVFSVMLTLLLFLIYTWIDPIITTKTTVSANMIYSFLAIITAVTIGLPWIVFVKNIFYKKQEGWLDSIGWVYGIITGFVLVLYQFIIA